MIATNQYHCTCQPAILAANRKAKNRVREVDPVRKAEVAAWCVGKVCTCGCGKPANCPHHPNDTLYSDQWANLDECEPWYSRCHHNYHRGLERCPKCGGWMKRGREICYKCEPARSKNVRYRLIRHPCGHNFGNQIYRRAGGQTVCARSPRHAAGCDYFIGRIPA